jgi:4-amino-4-deoxy-L-arabinose transferase-like glycosyltransferase
MNAQSMLDEGCWGLPHLFDGRRDLQKPPLYYWLVAATAMVRSGPVDAWTVRFPAALAGLLGVVALFLFGWLLGRPRAGFIAAVVLATAVHYTWAARVGRIDMPLTLTIGLTLGGYYLARTHGWRAGCWLAYLATAAGLLLKGPIALVLPAVVIAAHLFTDRFLGGVRSSHHPVIPSLHWGMPLLLFLVLPWYLWVGAHTDGEFYRVFFWRHNLERGLGGTTGMHARPWWFYGPRLAIDFLPWSPGLLLAGWLCWQRGWGRDPLLRFGLVWLGSMIGLLSCFGFKRADYLLPAYPGAALFLGCVAERWYLTLRRPGFAVAGCVTLLAACLVGWWLQVAHFLPAQEPTREHRSFAAAIRRHVPQPQLVLFFRTEAHALAWHLGRPLDTFLEWENLDVWAGRPGCWYIVMPPQCAAEWPHHLRAGQLEEVLRNTDLAPGHEQPLVLMRTRPFIH